MAMPGFNTLYKVHPVLETLNPKVPKVNCCSPNIVKAGLVILVEAMAKACY